MGMQMTATNKVMAPNCSRQAILLFNLCNAKMN
jgi:hypothetical protein